MTVDCFSSARSGKFGAVFCNDTFSGLNVFGQNITSGLTRIARVTRWEGNVTVEDHSWHDSGGGDFPSHLVCFKNRIPGPIEFTGSLDFVWETTIAYGQFCNILAGKCCLLVLAMSAPTSGIGPLELSSFVLNQALFTNVRVEVDVNDGSPVSGSADFGSDGVFWGPCSANVPTMPTFPVSPTGTVAPGGGIV